MGIMNYWLIFITGLTTGGLTCLAVQGGLLASAMVDDEELDHSKHHRAKTITIFLIAKLSAYSILGLALGALGSYIALSPKTMAWVSIVIALYMIGIACDAFKLHPIFRYFLIQPPKFIRKKIKTTATNKGYFTAVVLGLFTVLIPCGTTQAMMALAVSSGSALAGFTTMFSFIFGTLPVFFILGLLTVKIGGTSHAVFLKLVGILLIIIALYNISSSARILGFRINRQVKSDSQTQTIQKTDNKPEIQKVEIKLNDSYGYNPETVKLKVGVPAEIKLINDGARGCIRAFIVPDLNLRELLNGNSVTFTFTPDKKGKIPFTCSMGMYWGQFVVE